MNRVDDGTHRAGGGQTQQEDSTRSDENTLIDTAVDSDETLSTTVIQTDDARCERRGGVQVEFCVLLNVMHDAQTGGETALQQDERSVHLANFQVEATDVPDTSKPRHKRNRCCTVAR